MRKPIVVAVAAVTAGGKTTAIHALAERLPGARALYFDDYSFPGEPDDFGVWLASGADYQVWNLEPLRRDMDVLLSTGTRYLILDYPFAYRNALIAPLIDLAVFLDTPLDVALARRILRDHAASDGDAIRAELQVYLEHARPAFLEMLRTVRPDSDLIIDGTLPPAEIAARIAAQIAMLEENHAAT